MRFLLAILLLLLAAPAFAQSQGQGMSKALVVSSCGGGALPSGTLNQLTMDTTGRLCQSTALVLAFVPRRRLISRAPSGAMKGATPSISQP